MFFLNNFLYKKKKKKKKKLLLGLSTLELAGCIQHEVRVWSQAGVTMHNCMGLYHARQAAVAIWPPGQITC